MIFSDDYQVQNVYRYSRKSYKKSRRTGPEDDADDIEVAESSPRSGFRCDYSVTDPAACSTEPDPEGNLANILHKKCPVISLAQQQLNRLLDETDRLLCDNTRCCKSFYDFFCMCKEFVLSPNKCNTCTTMAMLIAIFLIGILFGAASCGTHLGQFDSPILSCIDSYFIPDSYPTLEQSYHSIV